MDLPTYTNIWRIEKRLYKLYDFRLPMPLPVGTFGVALGVFALWVILLSLVNAPFVFGNGWHLVLWVVPPGVITVLATRPVIEGKRLTELLISQARFLAESRVYTRLAPEYEPAEVRVAVRVWHRDPAAGPLPLPVRRRAEQQSAEQRTDEQRRSEQRTDEHETVEHQVPDTVSAPEREAAVRPSRADAPPLRGVSGRGDRTPVAAAEEEVPYTPVEPERAAPAEPARVPAAAPRLRSRSAHGPERHAPARTEAAPARDGGDPVERNQGEASPAERNPGQASPAERTPAERTPVERSPASTERAPVAVAARPEPEDRRTPATPREEESSEVEPAGGDPGTPEGPRRGVGRRVLNYFGFALGSGAQEPAEESHRSEADTGDAREQRTARERDARETREEREAREDFDEDFTAERVYESEGEEQRDSDAWFARLRASSGETPVGLTSKSAYSVGDTTAMSRAELADAVDARRAAREHGSEEAANAPATEEETPAARRLRGRTQGLRVAKDLEERRADRVRERGPKELRTARARGQGLPDTGEAPERPRRRGRPHAAPWELGEGKAEPAEGHADLSDYAARYAAATGRPAAEAGAVPWLPPSSAAPEEESGADADGPDDAATGVRGEPVDGRRTPDAGGATDGAVADRADRADAEAHGERAGEPVPERDADAADTPRKPSAQASPANGAEAPERTVRQPDVPGRTDADASGTGRSADDRPSVAPRRAAAASVDTDRPDPVTGDTGAAPETRVEPVDDREAPATTGDAASDTVPNRAIAASVDTDQPGTVQHGDRAEAPARSGEAEAVTREGSEPGPALELDHGTGEQDAIPRKPHEEPEDHGPEWNEHMSVLEQHLITADTPAPPRPKFADAVSPKERGGAVRDPAQWFEDGKKRHPDQPKVGDRGNPVIPASELREENAVPSAPEDTSGTGEEDRDAGRAGPTPDDEPKPPTQLDHGTGELVSFAEVREEPGRGDVNVRADSTTEPVRRRTVSDLERAEAAALERRRASARRDASRDSGAGGTSDSGQPTAEAPRSGASGRTSDDASPRARWSMRATGTTDDRGTGAEEEGRTAAVRDPRANPSMAGALAGDRASARTEDAERADGRTGNAERAEGRDDAPARAGGQPDDAKGTGESEGAGGPHDGVFHRVAQNARRLGQLFGQPAPGEEPEPPAQEPRPALELDHGTGEQERLGDTPNGVPAQRPEEPRRRPEEPASDSGGTRGWRRLAKVVTGGAAPVRSDLPASDIERLRTPLDGPRSLVVLGCTGGAGQTVTGLMIGHTLAAHRDDRVVAVDVNPGPNGLSRRVGAQTPETLTGLLANAEAIQDYSGMSGYTNRTSTGLEVVQTLDDPYVQTLDDRDYGQLSSLLGGFYGITLLDPAATGVARALPVADGLVLVAPANADAERAVSMTFDWLDGNGYGALRARSVLVVNGVSKRSLQDVDAAERVARGRCRAIVRIPWDDHLGSSYTRIDVGALRSATKRAHGALGGVLVNSLAQ